MINPFVSSNLSELSVYCSPVNGISTLPSIARIPTEDTSTRLKTNYRYRDASSLSLIMNIESTSLQWSARNHPWVPTMMRVLIKKRNPIINVCMRNAKLFQFSDTNPSLFVLSFMNYYPLINFTADFFFFFLTKNVNCVFLCGGFTNQRDYERYVSIMM